MTAESVGVRLQGLSFTEQTIIICRIAEARSATGNLTSPELEGLFDSLAVPRPAKMNNILLSLERSGVLSKPKGSRGQYRLTPQGRARSVDLLDHMDLRALLAESNTTYGAELGSTTHPIVPASLAPPELLNPIRAFLHDYPFDRNIFAMTRFPESDESVPDPVAVVLPVAREVCAQHGFTLHLASDRAIVDDLWGNVLAHMWASRYGLAIVEDRLGRGMNYNLTIEIGGMLTTGRRTALLKDASIARLPTDLVGKIYKDVDLENPSTVREQVHRWLRDDIGSAACDGCPH